MKNKIIILSILFTTNNIIFTLTDLTGNVIFWTSSGAKKVKGAKKITLTSISLITKEISKYIISSNYKYIYIKMKGFNKNKKIVIKYLKQLFSNILLISDNTTFPHNGCKRSNIRRI